MVKLLLLLLLTLALKASCEMQEYAEVHFGEMSLQSNDGFRLVLEANMIVFLSFSIMVNYIKKEHRKWISVHTINGAVFLVSALVYVATLVNVSSASGMDSIWSQVSYEALSFSVLIFLVYFAYLVFCRLPKCRPRSSGTPKGRTCSLERVVFAGMNFCFVSLTLFILYCYQGVKDYFRLKICAHMMPEVINTELVELRIKVPWHPDGREDFLNLLSCFVFGVVLSVSVYYFFEHLHWKNAYAQMTCPDELGSNHQRAPETGRLVVYGGQKYLYVIIGLNALIWFVWNVPALLGFLQTTKSESSDKLMDSLEFFLNEHFTLSRKSPWYTLLTSALSHKTVLSLAFTVALIAFYGVGFISILGKDRFMLYYILASIWTSFGAKLYKIVLDDNGPTCGAFGTMVAIVAYMAHASFQGDRASFPYLPHACTALVCLVVFDIIKSYLSWNYFDHAAQVSAYLVAMVCYWYSYGLFREHSAPSEQRK